MLVMVVAIVESYCVEFVNCFRVIAVFRAIKSFAIAIFSGFVFSIVVATLVAKASSKAVKLPILLRFKMCSLNFVR